MKSTIVRRLWTIGRCVLAGILLWWVLRTINGARLLETIQRTSWPLMLIAFMFLLICQVLNVVKWHMTAALVGLRIPYPLLAQSYLAGLFASNFLPSVFGGDIVRVLIVPVKHGSYATITASVVLDRLISLWALFFLPSLCAVFARVEVPFFSRAVLLWWGVGLVLVTAALFSGIGPHLLRGLLISQFSVIQRLIHLWDVLSQDRRLLVWSFVIGEAAQLLAVASSVLILRAVGQIVAFWDAGLISVLIRIGAMLPITINGIGLRENLATSLVTLLGATREDGLLLAFTSYLFGLVISLAGVLPILGFNNLRLTGGWSHEH